VAFLSDRGGIRDVWLMNPDGSAPRQLTAGLAPVSGYDVTADGARVVYASGGAIRLMRIDGTDESVLTADGVLEYAPRFSPDEQALLLARRDATGADLGWWLVPLGDASGEERQLVPTGAPPLGSTALPEDGLQPGEGTPPWSARSAWDPTGQWLLLTTASGEVVLVDTTAAGAATGVTPTGLVGQAGGAWSPAGSRFVVVAREAAGVTEGLYTIDIDGTVRRRLDAVGSVATAEDGSVVFLVRDSAGATHVAVGGVEGDRQPQPLTSGTGMWDRWPTFSPDGRAILFGRVFPEGGTASAGIWTIDPAGGAPVALTTDGAYPRWLP
jgi:Tol biopolymer transport system component